MKSSSLFLCVILVLVNLTGCLSYEYAEDLWDESAYEIDYNDTREDVEYNNSENSWEKVEIAGDEEIPVFSSLVDLRDYINANYEQGILKMSFKYTGSQQLTSEKLIDLVTALHISYTYDSNSVYELTLSDFVGNKIIRAYNSGNLSSLNKDEINALNKAIDIVNLAKNNTNSAFELELYIHDYLASVIDYSYKGANVSDPENLPRHLTVVGALLDGSANCQGYADAFYVLASLAGFEVGKLSVTSEGEGHMVNTIKLDGNWYVVDVTFDDTSDTSDAGTCSYMSFNIGKDLCINYEWSELSEYHLIAPYTDNHFYYYSNDDCVDFGYEKVFHNVDDMACEIVSKWDKYGINDFHVALIESDDFKDFSDEVYNKVSETGKSCSYSYSFSDNSRDYFVHFVFE